MSIKHFFLPTSANNFAPHLLQKTAFVLMCGLVILTFVAVNVQTVWWLSSSWLVGTVLPAVVIDQTNTERQDLRELPLKRNALLDKAAELKAEDMAKKHYFAHNSPEGVTPWHWFDEVAYQYSHAGENLAIHFTDSSAVVAAWMASPAHRANIVNGSYTEIGVGTAEGEYEGFKTVFVVQLFGTPAAAIQPAQKKPPVVAKVETAPVNVELGLGTEMTTAKPVVLSESERVIASETKVEPVATLNHTLQNRNLFAATSSGLLSAMIATDTNNLIGNAGSTMTERYATMPSKILQIIYMIIGGIVAFLLLISVAISMRYHRPWQLAYGIGLLVLMTGLFYIHTLFTAQVVIAATS